VCMYEFFFVRSIFRLSKALWLGFDVAVIDRIVLMFGRVTLWTGQTARVVQTGSIQIYAIGMFIGMIMIIGYVLFGAI